MQEWIVKLLCSLTALVVVAVAYHFGPQTSTRGHQWIPHAATVAIAVLLALLLPTSVADVIFTPLTSVLAGTVFPIYESIRAVCTPDESDDKKWLQYWISGGVVFMCTEWVGHVIAESNRHYWYECTFIFFVWSFHPLTDGAAMIYDKITTPLLGPRIKVWQAKMTNWITALYQLAMNAAHLWVVWIIFIFLPKGMKRAISVALGTVYPLISSIAASATEEVCDDTYWLTYWSVYGCLFVLMDVLETWLGWIPGFYTLVIATTIYLMLPMFQGSDKLFRKVLVPLAGLQEMLMLRDAIVVKKQMLKDLDPERAKTVRRAIAQFYASDEQHDKIDLPKDMKKEYITSWSGIKMPKMSNPFAKGDSSGGAGEGGQANEGTPLV